MPYYDFFKMKTLLFEEHYSFVNGVNKYDKRLRWVRTLAVENWKKNCLHSEINVVTCISLLFRNNKYVSSDNEKLEY